MDSELWFCGMSLLVGNLHSVPVGGASRSDIPGRVLGPACPPSPGRPTSAMSKYLRWECHEHCYGPEYDSEAAHAVSLMASHGLTASSLLVAFPSTACRLQDVHEQVGGCESAVCYRTGAVRSFSERRPFGSPQMLPIGSVAAAVAANACECADHHS